MAPLPLNTGIRVFLLGGLIATAGSALDREAFVQRYCLGCHSASAHAGGFVLKGVSGDNPAERPGIWEKVIRRLGAGEMPPAAAPQPGNAEADAFSDELIDELDKAAQIEPYAGRPVIRRLNRTEYSNAIRDLLDLELPLADQLPPDGQAAGFDNIGDALSDVAATARDLPEGRSPP